MKRLSWTLSTYDLPDYDIYDKSTHRSSTQVPIDSGSRPNNNTFFIGITPTNDKVLAYHLNNGKYIVISYNYNSTKLLQSVIDNNIYEPQKTGQYTEGSLVDDNPASIPIINEDITSIS